MMKNHWTSECRFNGKGKQRSGKGSHSHEQAWDQNSWGPGWSWDEQGDGNQDAGAEKDDADWSSYPQHSPEEFAALIPASAFLPEGEDAIDIEHGAPNVKVDKIRIVETVSVGSQTDPTSEANHRQGATAGSRTDPEKGGFRG